MSERVAAWVSMAVTLMPHTKSAACGGVSESGEVAAFSLTGAGDGLTLCQGLPLDFGSPESPLPSLGDRA